MNPYTFTLALIFNHNISFKQHLEIIALVYYVNHSLKQWL